MKELARLTPAQTLLLLNGSNTVQREVLKYTLMDLLLKKILKISKRQFRASKYDPAQELSYIVTGKNFAGYKFAPYEEIFLRPFLKNKNLTILIKHMVKMGYENSQGKHHLQRLIYSSYELEGCIRKTIYHRIAGGFILSSKGKELKAKVQDELNYFNEYIPSIIASDKQKALEALRYIKGNIFLLTGIDFQLLKEIDKELADLDKKDDGTFNGCSGCFTVWDTFDTFTHVSCGSSDGGLFSFESGCSGCSGGGCSGCGGFD